MNSAAAQAFSNDAAPSVPKLPTESNRHADSPRKDNSAREQKRTANAQNTAEHDQGSQIDKRKVCAKPGHHGVNAPARTLIAGSLTERHLA